MTAVDQDAVQVLAVQLHRVECLPGSNPYARYSQEHRNVHARRAKLILFGLSEAGFHLTSKEG